MNDYLKNNYVQYIDQKVPKEKEIFNRAGLGLSIQVNTDFVKQYLNTSLNQPQKCFLKGPSTRNAKIQENNFLTLINLSNNLFGCLKSICGNNFCRTSLLSLIKDILQKVIILRHIKLIMILAPDIFNKRCSLLYI